MTTNSFGGNYALLLKHTAIGWCAAKLLTGLEAVEKHGSVAPHVTVMDFSMPVLDGLKASRLILVKHPDATILMVTVTVSPQLVREAKKAGIKGFCHKEHAHCIIDAIEALLRGETYYPSQVH